MPDNFRVQGAKELQTKIMKLGKLDGGKVLRNATLIATTPIINEARRRIPENDRTYLKATYKGRMVAPGFAKRNIARKVILSRDKSRANALVGVKSEAYYAVQFVELGTSKQVKQAWLEPAFRNQKEAAVARFGAQVKRKIEAIARTKL